MYIMNDAFFSFLAIKEDNVEFRNTVISFKNMDTGIVERHRINWVFKPANKDRIFGLVRYINYFILYRVTEVEYEIYKNIVHWCVLPYSDARGIHIGSKKPRGLNRYPIIMYDADFKLCRFNARDCEYLFYNPCLDNRVDFSWRDKTSIYTVLSYIAQAVKHDDIGVSIDYDCEHGTIDVPVVPYRTIYRFKLRDKAFISKLIYSNRV